MVEMPRLDSRLSHWVDRNSPIANVATDPFLIEHSKKDNKKKGRRKERKRERKKKRKKTTPWVTANNRDRVHVDAMYDFIATVTSHPIMRLVGPMK